MHESLQVEVLKGRHGDRMRNQLRHRVAGITISDAAQLQTPSRHRLLKPMSAKVDVPDLAQPPPDRDPLARVGIGPHYLGRTLPTQVLHDGLDAQDLNDGLRADLELRLAAREGPGGLAV